MEAADPGTQRQWLFLEPSQEFRGCWQVDGLWPEWFLELEDIVGSYRLVTPARLDNFIHTAEKLGYKIVFTKPPERILEEYVNWNREPAVEIESTLPSTKRGMLPWQVIGFNKLVKDESIRAGYVVWDTGPQPADAPVLTPSGWRIIGALRPNDNIIGSDGNSHRVTGVYHYGHQEVVRLHFKDGSTAESTRSHLWGFYDHVGNYSVRPLQAYLDIGLQHKRGDARWFVDRVQPVNHPCADLPIDPYLLGVLLGDGSLTGTVPQVYSHQGEILENIRSLLPYNMRISRYGHKHFALVGSKRGHQNSLKSYLNELGIWGHTAPTKFIPYAYRFASVNQRLSILQGLLDTDGCAETQRASFSSVSQDLAIDVANLVRSLGGRAKISYIAARPDINLPGQRNVRRCAWRVRLVLPPEMEYFRLKRKRVLRRPDIGKNALVSIEPLGDREVLCISVDAIDGRYVTNDYILTHNSGKTAFIASAVKFHMEVGHPFNIALVVVKAHNKIATQRKLLQLGGVDSYIIDGTIEKRYNIYEQIQEDLKAGRRVVAITNYEKFRDDKAAFKHLLKRQECLFFWDEMPTKLSNRDTKLYKAVKESLYISFYSRPRTKWARHWVLTATPIENSPEDVFSCVHLIWPGLLGSVREFFDIHVMGINPVTRKPLAWKNLDHLEAKMSFMTHRVSKEDPEVAKMFPETSQEPAPIDWNPKHRAVYDRLTGKAHDILVEFEDINILSMIQVMQMVCDAPSMIKESAKNRERFMAMLEVGQDFTGPVGSEAAVRLASCVNPRHLTDVGHSKLDTWREILVEKHPEDKIVTHSTWASYIFPIWTYWLNKWNVSYVIYTGTDKQKQDALDQFRNDPSIRVFLSGDSGSDSIDIPEARVGVNYNIPWKWTTLKQREGRRDRVNSNFDSIFTYTLIMPDSVDERKLEICERKHQYHQAIFDGRVHDEAISATMTKEDLQYILTGSRDY